MITIQYEIIIKFNKNYNLGEKYSHNFVRDIKDNLASDCTICDETEYRIYINTMTR